MDKISKKITFSNLADKFDKLASNVETGFIRMSKGFEETAKSFKDAKENNESLARMVANGFEHTTDDAKSIKSGIVTLEQGQENILLRLDSMAPFFEVKQLERRVKRLEDKAGIRHAVQR